MSMNTTNDTWTPTSGVSAALTTSLTESGALAFSFPTGDFGRLSTTEEMKLSLLHNFRPGRCLCSKVSPFKVPESVSDDFQTIRNASRPSARCSLTIWSPGQAAPTLENAEELCKTHSPNSTTGGDVTTNRLEVRYSLKHLYPWNKGDNKTEGERHFLGFRVEQSDGIAATDKTWEIQPQMVFPDRSEPKGPDYRNFQAPTARLEFTSVARAEQLGIEKSEDDDDEDQVHEQLFLLGPNIPLEPQPARLTDTNARQSMDVVLKVEATPMLRVPREWTERCLKHLESNGDHGIEQSVPYRSPATPHHEHSDGVRPVETRSDRLEKKLLD